MLLTLFYMISTWVQAWKLSSLRARLTTALNYNPKPSIMFYIKPPDQEKNEPTINKINPGNGICEDLLSSHLCNNKSAAKLIDLLWCQGDKRLCTIYPQQTIDVSSWLLYPPGKTYFPLYMDNCSQAKLTEDSKIHMLVEADIDHFHVNAFAKATKLEEYGLIVAWTAGKLFAAIIETDVDHMTKLSISLMQGQCFINNGLLLTRIESIEVTGKPCSYNFEKSSTLQNKKLVGKAQWDAHMKTLKQFSNTAKYVSQEGKSFEVDEVPGIFISPGDRALTLHIPTILEMTLQTDDFGDNEKEVDNSHEIADSPLPSTPPPTPASVSATTSTAPLEFPQSQIIIEENQSPVLSDNQTKAQSQISLEKPTKTRQLKMTTNRASEFSPGKKPNFINSVPVKPPNVLIYADSAATADNIEHVLKLTLNRDKYIIYKLKPEDARRDVWLKQATLMIVCGNVGSEIASQLVDYIVEGGKLLALCSDALHTLLPSFKTAEVREHELVRFSYGKWKNVQMMHHIFCYQASPVKSRFSQDNEDVKFATPQTPVSANVKDKDGKSHTFQIKVLGKEETWQTPSIVLADLPSSNGKAVFSQIHLEADPSQYEVEEIKYRALKESNSARLEIFSDLLNSHLNMDVKPKTIEEPIFSPGFFLGRHELKLEMLEKLKEKLLANDVFETDKIKLQFCGGSTKLLPASNSLLPIMMHQCPENFSTIEYFESLKTKELGRLVIYADLMTSSMDVVAGRQLHHGLTVIPRRQTTGKGRGKNLWLSPKGCAMFTMQLYIPLDSYIGRHLSIIQHIVATALVAAVRNIDGYENLDLRLKWPNDIYAGDQVKIGGLITTSLVESQKAVVNIGLGINLSNNLPTCCINDIINKYNQKNGTKLSLIPYERFLALVFNELESLIDTVQDENMENFYHLYYEYWLHTDAEVTVITSNKTTCEAKILGIDSYGFLEVQDHDGKIFTVQPDGNSFDLLKGLIAPSR